MTLKDEAVDKFIKDARLLSGPPSLEAMREKKPSPNYDPSIIRVAEWEEAEDVFKLCQELHAENGIFSFSAQKIRAHLKRAFDRKGAMVAVIGKKGAIEAAMFLSIDQYYYTEEWNLGELFTYVRPAYRRSQHAKSLLEWAKGASDNLGLRLFVGIVTGERLVPKLRLYFRQFISPAGVFFVYTPKTLYSAGQTAGNASSH
jgi:GNAT superfamily N-acetyltransferase